MEDHESGDRQALANETRDIWERNAAFWDDFMGEGRSFQKELIGPPTERLLGPLEAQEVLDIGCGNGAFSRRLAALGARVQAFDVSPAMIERARRRTAEHADRIDYRVVDATDLEALLALGTRRFHAAVCTMALMDIPEVEPLLTALARLLVSGGRFVFSVTHPCFNNPGAARIVEDHEDTDSGEPRRTRSVRVTRYLGVRQAKGVAVVGQPVAQNYFHRPLGELFRPCFAAGFVLDALEEAAFPEPPQGSQADPLSWSRFSEIPPVMIARLLLR